MKLIGTLPSNKEWLDFSSLTLLMKCPRKYYWRHELNLATAELRPALINGKAYHDGIAAFHTHLLSNNDFQMACMTGIECALRVMQGITVEDPKRNSSVCAETLAGYFTKWQDSDYKTLEVEIGFAADLIDFVFVGKIDRYVDSSFGKMVMETKTTSIVGEKWGKRGKPNLQIDGYTAGIYILTGEMPYGGVLDIIPIHEDSRKRKEPFRIITSRSLGDVEAWNDNIHEWWNTLSRYRESGTWPQNTQECVPILGYECEFQSLCTLYPRLVSEQDIKVPDAYIIEKWEPFEMGG